MMKRVAIEVGMILAAIAAIFFFLQAVPSTGIVWTAIYGMVAIIWTVIYAVLASESKITWPW
jgi:hypothetical protein